jgi:hypothetical protein
MHTPSIAHPDSKVVLLSDITLPLSSLSCRSRANCRSTLRSRHRAHTVSEVSQMITSEPYTHRVLCESVSLTSGMWRYQTHVFRQCNCRVITSLGLNDACTGSQSIAVMFPLRAAHGHGDDWQRKKQKVARPMGPQLIPATRISESRSKITFFHDVSIHFARSMPMVSCSCQLSAQHAL